ncbi:MAG TPA: tetratricopeptide repeat protein, partial [Ktedonobacterales bacterium]|nr:tetratricopeptide repeat protein [Ktedonobacterales bacterium]
VMEYIPGETLEQRLERTHQPLPERDVLGWMSDICDILDYLHKQRPPIIIRDLKPANIIITPSGKARLIDFGIARTYKTGKTTNTDNVGTAIYASPEHYGRGQTDARSDIYSLGVTMAHVLTSKEPVPMAMYVPGELRGRPPQTPLFSEATERIVIKATSLKPDDRYTSARELRAALQASLAALPTARVSAVPQRAAAATRPVRAVRATTPAKPAAPNAESVSSGKAPAVSVSGIGATSIVGLLCPRCGFMNRPNARFCTKDGAPLSGAVGVNGRQPRQAPSRASGVYAAPSTQVITAPSQAQAFARRASESLTGARYAQAIAAAEAAIAQGHATAEVYLTLARAYHQTGRFAEAANAFEQAARLRPTAETLTQAGQDWRAAGKYDQAQIALTRARQLDPHNPEIPYQLGMLCFAQGQLAQAEGELREALALHPAGKAPTQVFVTLAQVYCARKQWADAITLLRQALQRDPHDVMAHRELQLAEQHIQR